jgi:hypothetical protein
MLCTCIYRCMEKTLYLKVHSKFSKNLPPPLSHYCALHDDRSDRYPYSGREWGLLAMGNRPIWPRPSRAFPSRQPAPPSDRR